MTLHGWWLFTGAVFLLCGTPGPNMLHILSRSIDMGMKRSIAAMAGCLTALVMVLGGSAAGLSTLLRAVPGAFDVLRYVGIAYLVYLGIKAWRSEVAPMNMDETAELPRGVSVAALFRGGFAIGISNPKLILFAAAFLPQFVNPHAPQGPQYAILVTTFAVLELFWYGVYAAGGSSLSRAVKRPAIRRTFNRLTGAIFIAFGLALLKAKPS